MEYAVHYCPDCSEAVSRRLCGFGLQCYAGSLAFLILLGKLWPAFLTLGGDFKLLGLSLPGVDRLSGVLVD